MKYIKEYLCDKRTPPEEEIKECLEIVSKEDCVVKLAWFVRYKECIYGTDNYINNF